MKTQLLRDIAFITMLFIFQSSVTFSQTDFYYSRGEKVQMVVSQEAVVIKFKEDITVTEINTLLSSEDAVRDFNPLTIAGTKGFFKATLKLKTNLNQLMNRLKGRKEVKAVNNVYTIEGLEAIPYDQFMVQFKASVNRSQVEALNNQHSVEIIEMNISVDNLYKLRVTETSNLSVVNMAKLYYESLPAEWSTPDFIMPVQLYTPNDTYFANQYYLHNTGQTGGVTDADIDALEAWNITTGSSSITVAVIDEGGSIHEDLPENRIVTGYDYYYLDSDPSAGGNEAHGMASAGVVAGTQNNGVGITGVASGCKVMHLRIFNECGWGTSNSNIANAIDFAWQNGADIISNSWGYGSSDPNLVPAIVDAINRALTMGRGDGDLTAEPGDKGCVVVFAAGNTANRGSGNYGYVSFPACVPGVLAVGATDKSNNIQYYSPRDNELAVVAPSGDLGYYQSGNLELRGDVWSLDIPSQPGWNPGNYSACQLYIWNPPGGDAYPPGNYTAHFGGTSAACPQAAGVAALILSVNPALEGKPTNPQVQNIIKQTADDMGTTGYDTDFGYGRVNAFQSILLALAYANKSASYWASGYNNNHTLERGYSGKLHEVFHSFGEIFYRRSSNNGSTWEITARLSSGNGANEAPSIVAGYGDVLCVVWQRKIDNYNYEIYLRFSSDMGTTWLNAPSPISVTVSWNQSNGYYGPGTTPIVASYFRGGSEGVPSFLLVYAAQDGLYYRTATTYSSGWSSANVIPGSSGAGSSIWFPSLASYNSQNYNVNLIYDDRWTNVYSQIFNESSGWTSRVPISFIGSSNRNSSITVDYSNNTLGVWSGWNGSNYTIRFRQGFSDGTWSSWTKEWAVSGVNSFYPAITYYNKGGSYPYGIDILWHTSNNQIRQKKYYGLGDNWIPSDPNTQLLASNGLFSNLTHERQNTTVPIQTWTDQSSSPIYSILYNSSYLPKENLLAEGELRRAAQITDKSSSTGLSIEISQPVVRLNNGETKVIPFKEFDYTKKLSLSFENIFDYLKTEALSLPENAEAITVDVEYRSSLNDTLADGSLNESKETPFKDITFELLGVDKLTNGQLSSAGTQTLKSLSGIHNISKTFRFNVHALKGKEIFLLPKAAIVGSFNSEDLDFSLSNISIEVSSKLPKDIVSKASLPNECLLEQNYPNPFNPTTVIKYSIPDAMKVNLTIYDILGKEIKTLVDEDKAAGSYEVIFDASNISSGVYLYKLTTPENILTGKMSVVK